MAAPGYYALIPASVRYDNELKPNAKLLYGEITALCNAEGYCWADNDYFAQLYDVNIKTISRWISQLRDRDYIEVEILHNSGNKRRITIDKKVTTSCRKDHDLVTERALASDEKSTPIKENTTYNNTINREGEPLEFLEKTYPSVFERLMMKYKSRLGNDFKLVCDDYNAKVKKENLDFKSNVLEGRFEQLANNWIRNKPQFAANNTAPETVAPYHSKKII
ncbi:MAG: hypothetical protein BM557_09615 [Flavobacterium sp. MedPE-SWcel]|uniref:helix-turn-helix domain-containing protein n=1 Tax=uncultured Flavobacterium sp. TaxID=165435 RepID=UPI00092159FF|nr:helix-turn-helix domain-containing protein [uncultured Flavobacterium sp.]OIQ16561.1 MAG: hypothetical protein BM557_09615 [Flavobacterium sp. MedPE-SWcel]